MILYFYLKVNFFLFVYDITNNRTHKTLSPVIKKWDICAISRGNK